jgi:RHS repeat-associated protein
MKSLKYIAILLLIFTAELAATILPPTSRGAYSSGRRLIGQTITFTGSGSFDNDSQTGEYGPIWLWDFEYDGTNFSGDIQTGSMTAAHVYNTPGVYKVGVQYRDDDEQWGSVYTFTITINRVDRYYYVKDHLGSVRQTVNGSGAIVSAQDYYPYGEVLRAYNNSLANEKYKFTEKERDVETGFDYSISRYYDNKLGVWLQVDPMGDDAPG